MAVYNNYTTWLLGAGFSRALGGPLLDDLFRHRNLGDDELVFPNRKYSRLGLDLYISRLCCAAGKREGLWQNAEDFLAFHDAAHRASSTIGRSRLQRFMYSLEIPFIPGSPEFDRFVAARETFFGNPAPLRRALAAECAAFLMELDDDEEIWQPYLAWAGSLEPGRDTVISFNYDLVLEKLAARPGSKLRVLLPSECPQGPKQLPRDVVPVFKLHGSVDWQKNQAGQVERRKLDEILADTESAPFIAAPGRSKQDAVKELEPLWREARNALGRAWALEIVGYGFPATDTAARTWIQSAYSSGSGPSGEAAVWRIDVVLGPDTSRPEARRVLSLLETFGRSDHRVVWPARPVHGDSNVTYLKVHPLWAQDFLFDYKERTREPERRQKGEIAWHD